MCFFFFFQAEDGIRDDLVTVVQTVCSSDLAPPLHPPAMGRLAQGRSGLHGFADTEGADWPSANHPSAVGIGGHNAQSMVRQLTTASTRIPIRMHIVSGRNP